MPVTVSFEHRQVAPLAHDIAELAVAVLQADEIDSSYVEQDVTHPAVGRTAVVSHTVDGCIKIVHICLPLQG